MHPLLPQHLHLQRLVMKTDNGTNAITRRTVVKGLAAACVIVQDASGGPATTQSQSINPDDVAALDLVVGRNFGESQQKQMLGILNTRRKKYAELRTVQIDPNTEPAMRF